MHALGVVAYATLVGWFMHSGPLKGPDSEWIFIPVLLLLTLSAAVMGILIFGRPVYLFLEGHKRTALQFLFCTVGFIFVFTVIAVAIVASLPRPHLIQG